MAHELIGNKVVIDWATGDPEGDRLKVLAAYRDFINEIKSIVDNDDPGITSLLLKEVFNKWGVHTDSQIDEVPRIWIKRPE